MVNAEIKLTAENEFLKAYLLDHFNTDDISVAYGCFYNPQGYFSIGRKELTNGKYCFFFRNHEGIKTIELENYDDEAKLKECLALVGIALQEKKEEKPEHIKGVQTSIFDLGW